MVIAKRAHAFYGRRLPARVAPAAFHKAMPMRFFDFLSFLFTGKPFSAQELAEVHKEISFSEAIEAHIAWKQHLIDFITGRAAQLPNGDNVCDDTRCVLGQWIHGSGRQRYGYLSSFAELSARHANFHHVACEIVELVRANKTDEATHLLYGEFKQASIDTISRIRGLSKMFGS